VGGGGAGFNGPSGVFLFGVKGDGQRGGFKKGGARLRTEDKDWAERSKENVSAGGGQT